MTDYIAILETETNPGAPSKSSLWKRWAKNWIAGFEGAIGAPRLQLAALDPGFITAGGIGSYVFAICSAASVAFGSTVAGSTLNPVSAARSFAANGSGTVSTFAAGSALTGTWRCMGTYNQSTGSSYLLGGSTLWLRIA